MKKYVFEDKMGETYHINADNEQDAWEKFAEQVDYPEEDRDILVNEFTLKSDYGEMSSGSPKWFQNSAISKEQCDEYGGIWVHSYYRNGKHISGYGKNMIQKVYYLLTYYMIDNNVRNT